ncbi:peroxisomal adenine nucleotide transporter 1 [Dichotomopilus funicola]|uniref:Peroxisomal adenine nucleotide transporter 1 n=1 Tax=Dichotomopilus funicola TaxID=1934379 RepID=A0AAN6ZNX3_9PEZI|nr:peroxisomal adenine nucleotide transporter 1 [Dichotomopilus funicola]
MPSTPNLLPALGHAASGAAGTVVSTAATYPLDLVNTRLKVQRQLARDGSMDAADAYEGVLDAFGAIYSREGGVKAFFAGLGADAGKSAVDSGLFFLFYTWFRARRLAAHKSVPYLGVAEELAVGAAAGACAKLFTTPVSNVVTRRQTASLLHSSSSSSPSSTIQPETEKSEPEAGTKSEAESTTTPPPQPTDLTLTQHLSALRRERGLRGLWAGYSASLVLTLNPSLTFFLQQAIRRVLLSRGQGKRNGDSDSTDDLSAATTFFLAAGSKVVATAVTYPFLVAKARMQVSAGGGASTEDDGEDKGDGKKKRGNIFATVWRIGKAEGVSALYDGISGELLKGFFSHGTTMLAKDVIHRFIVQVYMAVVALLLRNPQWVLPVITTVGRVRQGLRKRVGKA